MRGCSGRGCRRLSVDIRLQFVPRYRSSQSGLFKVDEKTTAAEHRMSRFHALIFVQVGAKQTDRQTDSRI